MKYNCFLPLLISLAVIILSEIFFFWPQMIYVILVLAVLLFLFTLRQFKQASLKKEKWWNFLILPSCFYVGLIVFSSLIPNKLLVQLLFIFNTVFLYFYFRSLYYYLIKPDFYQDHSLENFSSCGNFLAFLFYSFCDLWTASIFKYSSLAFSFGYVGSYWINCLSSNLD